MDEETQKIESHLKSYKYQLRVHEAKVEYYENRIDEELNKLARLAN